MGHASPTCLPNFEYSNWAIFIPLASPHLPCLFLIFLPTHTQGKAKNSFPNGKIVTSIQSWKCLKTNTQYNSSGVKKIQIFQSTPNFFLAQENYFLYQLAIQIKVAFRMILSLVMRLSPFSYILWLRNPSNQVEAVVLHWSYSSATRNLSKRKILFF